MRLTKSKLRRIIRQSIVETYDGEGRPNWDNEEKLRKAGKFDKSNISKADEEQTAAELKYREDLRKDYERKLAEIEKMKQDRNARKKGERYRFDEASLRRVIRNVIKESIFKSENPPSSGFFSAGDDRYQDLARAYHQIGGKLVNGRELGTVPSDKQEVIDAIEDCREWTRNYLEETGREYPPTDDQTPWTKEYLAANPNGNMGLWHLRFIAMWCRMEAVPAYETGSLLDRIKNDKRYNK